MLRATLIAALLATTPAFAGEMPNPMLTPAQAGSDVALLRRALETIHPGLYRYGPKASVDASFARLEAQAKAPISTLALHREIARLVASIHCDHSKPELIVTERGAGYLFSPSCPTPSTNGGRPTPATCHSAFA